MKLEELKEGMYIRTLLGNIYKIQDEEFEIKQSAFTGDILYKKNNEFETITKASYNIIDLIEEGDYVNGYKVYEVDKVCHRITLNGSDDGNEFRLTYLRPSLGKNMGIKSIVTKEQFDSMKYEVDSNE